MLYRGRDFSPTADWRGRAPHLWPATGRNRAPERPGEFGWTWAGRWRPMPLHGFARDVVWTGVRLSRSEAVVRLSDDAASRVYYPFGFRLSCRYTLGARSLTMRYEVIAASTNTRPMPFSIGNHLTFHVPLVAGRDPANVTLRTSGRGDRDDAAPFATPTPLVRLAPREAIGLSRFPGRPRVEIGDEQGLRLRISHQASRRASGRPYRFTLWGDPKAEFFSLEPWIGRPNSLVSGEGLIRLPPAERFNWTVTISVED